VLQKRNNICLSLVNINASCFLPHCEGAKCASNSYTIDDDMINGENFFTFDWEHDSTFEMLCLMDDSGKW
jgi:hypothetical protein